MRELRAVLREARQPEGQPPVASPSQVASRTAVNDNVVRKFEKGESAPNYDRLDPFFASYADAISENRPADAASFLDYLDDAIKRAKRAGPLSLEEWAAQGAAEDAVDASRATSEFSPRSSGTRAPRANRHRDD